MKKGVFTVANYFAPKRGLAIHALLRDRRPQVRPFVALVRFVGHGQDDALRGPKRDLIGDDEHVWSDDGVFNIEGGCYAKAINLSPESEPEIFQALRFGAVLENVVLEDDRSVDFADTTITENTRGAYPSLHQERADPVHGRPPDGRDLPHLRCVRRTPP